ncbi:MAG TPA: FAD-dependent oxidoreductase [Planctomycetota bacterium]
MSARVVVVGAGALGGWAALHLLRAGAQVSLLEAWGPGHARASSGGATRVWRRSYGPDRLYSDLAGRGLEHWLALEQRYQARLFVRTGLLWMVGDEDDAYERATLVSLAAGGHAHHELDAGAFAAAYPQVNPEGVRWAFVEEDAGYLRARRACRVVRRAFQAEGGAYRTGHLDPAAPWAGAGTGLELRLVDGERIPCDQVLLACGPWLGAFLPPALGEILTVTRQELFRFGTPPAEPRYQAPALPVFVDHGRRFWYGIPDADGRGLKLGDDTRGPAFCPDTADRTASAAGIERARTHLGERFPGLQGAPLLDARVCQYTQTPDGGFLLDRHPDQARAWLLGGGSGHAFKHAPALGEAAATAMLGDGAAPIPQFALARLAAGAAAHWPPRR